MYLKSHRTRFVDLIKNEGTDKAFEMPRLVVQAFNDQGKQNILTQAPTIQRASQRLILAIAPSITDANVYLRDISQAYTQSTTAMLRNIYVRAPTEMELPTNKILRVALPLYGIPEAGTHWVQRQDPELEQSYRRPDALEMARRELE